MDTGTLSLRDKACKVGSSSSIGGSVVGSDPFPTWKNLAAVLNFRLNIIYDIK